MMEKQRDFKILQMVTLLLLPLFWAGYFYALYSGNNGNVSNYTCLILAFSLVNADALFGGKKIQSKVLNVLAKLNGVLFFVWTSVTVIGLVLK